MLRQYQGGQYILLTQVDHARLAGEIAAVWGNHEVEPLSQPDVMLPAITHHDDGWFEWEQQPEVDPETGKPRDFREMPMDVATEIWTRSIEFCGNIAPLSGMFVSRHFCYLAEWAAEKRHDEPDEVSAIKRFLREQTSRQSAWREDCKLDANSFDEICEAGYRYVQMFDAISLWLCLNEDDTFECEAPSGVTIKWKRNEDGQIEVDPYPFAQQRAEHQFSIAARHIPARRYETNAEFQSVLESAKLRFDNFVLLPRT